MKKMALSEVKDDLSRYLHAAENNYYTPWEASRGANRFESEEDWFDYRLENDPRFLNRIQQARASIKAGKGIKLEDS